MTIPTRRPHAAVLLFATLAIGVVAPAAALHPNHPVGSDPERSADSFAEIDTVDLFSRSLSLAIPIGPFVLTNTSSVWHFRPDAKTGELLARPDWYRRAGIGWDLGVGGTVYHSRQNPYNPTGEWLYVDANGGRHSLYATLHRDDGDDGDLDDEVYYSRDSSYLRMTRDDRSCNASVRIEFPDGSTRRFDSGTCGRATTYRLASVWGPFSTEADPDLTLVYSEDPDNNPNNTEDTLLTITNRYDLTHKIYLSDVLNGDPKTPVHWVERIVTKVELESFDGQLSVYNFTYRQFAIDRNCKDERGGTISVPHLERVDLPDGTSYSMVGEDGSLMYESECREIDGVEVADLPGVIKGINLPSGGKIRWDWGEVEFPNDDDSEFDTSAGVKTRTLLRRDLAGGADVSLGAWTYKSTSIEAPDPEMHTEVVVYPTGDPTGDPTADCTKHYFDAIYDPPGNGSPRGFELGLPSVYSEASGGKYLSTQVHTGNDGKGSCDPDTKIRSTYLRFRHDATPPGNSAPQSEFTNTNRNVEASRVVYHDDENRTVDREWSDFDGLGHFRHVVQTSNLWGSQERETTTNYNRSNGTYPGTYTALQITEPWVLGVFDSVEVSDAGAVGMQTLKSEFFFEDATGFLECTRAYTSGVGRGTADLLSVRTRDARGRVEHAKLYGGDLQGLSTGGSECGTVPSEPVYWTSHEYDPLSGARTKTWPRHPDGTYGSFPTLDLDVEARTGIVINQRDTAGFETTFDYDEAGRVVSVTPEEGATAVFSYFNPTPTSQARVVTTVQSPDIPPTPLTQSETVLDDFGRPRLERQLLPAGVWSERETTYNARGWTESVSEWGDLGKKTVFSGFDPFGRPAVITPPDGPAHNVTRSYTGERFVWVTMNIALEGGEAEVGKTYMSDGFGRLVLINEASGSDPENIYVPTTYSYDVGGRLTEVRTGDAATGEQVRSFTYDGRGFLLAETHPEKGPAGNGAVTYDDYDAGGLAHSKVDGPNDLSFSFDFMGRPLEIRDRASGSRLVSSIRWDDGAGFGAGMLSSAERYNYLDLPWNGTGEEAVVVRQSFAYEGLAGLPDVKTTEVLWSSDDLRMTQTYTYDALGNISERGYPVCDLPAACMASSAGSGNTVKYSYDQGLLTAVPGWVSGITYHPSGLWQQITHANGVAEHQERDDDFSRRPKRLYTTGVSPGWNSDVMLYDGAGNLKARGTDAYTYDKVSRLLDASEGGGSYVQSYTYDRFGNITSVTGDTVGMFIPPVDPATNRVTGATYDAAGNMLTAPFPLPPGQFAYDTANRVVSQAARSYLYDAFGERAISLFNDGAEVPTADFHLRDLGNRLVSKIRTSQGEWSRERDYVFAGHRLLGRTSSEPSQGVRHFHLDHLGSVRLSTLANGDPGTWNTFMPYGERFGPESYADSLLFAGPHERDFSNDTDYMHARHYWWKIGRFNSPDPVLGSPSEPQSWNRYAYVMGNPLNQVDPTGMLDEPATDDPCARGMCEEITVTGSLYTSGRWGSISSRFGSLSAAFGGDLYSLPTRNHLAHVQPIPDRGTSPAHSFQDEIDVVASLPTAEELAKIGIFPEAADANLAIISQVARTSCPILGVLEGQLTTMLTAPIGVSAGRKVAAQGARKILGPKLARNQLGSKLVSARITVNTKGRLTISGTLANGTQLSQLISAKDAANLGRAINGYNALGFLGSQALSTLLLGPVTGCQ